MATAPQFTSQPTVDFGVVPAGQATTTTIASNMRNGSAGDSNYTLVAAGPSGSPAAGVGKRIARVKAFRNFNGTNTFSAGVLAFYYKANTATTGQNDYRLISEVFINTLSFSGTTAQDIVEVYDLVGLVLPAGSGIYCNFLSSNTSANLTVCVEGGLL